jgi:leucyl aminopeptidase
MRPSLQARYDTSMQTQILAQDIATVSSPLLAVFAVDLAEGKDIPAKPTLLTDSEALLKAAESILANGEFNAQSGETLLLHSPAGLACERLLIVGLGKLKSVQVDQARRGAGTAVRVAKIKSVKRLTIALPKSDSLPVAETARAIAEGAWIGEFDADTYRSERKDRSIEDLTVVGSAKDAAVEAAFAEGNVLGTSVAFTQALVNEPGNVLTPTELGKRAAAMCSEFGVQCEVHSTEKLKALGMGAFLGVAQGSAQPPALIVMTYEPKDAPKQGAPVIGLVGKGITFDTGGISIKPADGMEKMKYDMAGAAAMIGAMRAIAQLKPTAKVIGVVCSAENMPSSTAYKPGDVLTAMSGKTIEVMNTDAEGRLVLADGLHYAQQLGATHLIDAATLTGACVVALGTTNSGLFSNNEETYEAFQRAQKRTGEHFWRLPCTDDYRDFIKSSIADIMNTGMNRWGGAITAAMFLKEFVGETPWIHLDIAGQAWIEDQRTYIGKGPSGVALRTIVEWVRELSA